MKRHSVAVILAISMFACTTSPTSPKALIRASASGPVASYIVSGVVTAAGLGPIEGVQVVSDYPVWTINAGTLITTTDKDGLYRLTVDAGVRSLTLSRPGYVTDLRSWTISGDTRLDIQIVQNATVNGDTRFEILVARR
jgi:hypothetical protein